MFFVHNKTLHDLLSFSIYLIDDSNNELTFPPDENKTIVLNFKIHVFYDELETETEQITSTN